MLGATGIEGPLYILGMAGEGWLKRSKKTAEAKKEYDKVMLTCPEDTRAQSPGGGN